MKGTFVFLLLLLLVLFGSSAHGATFKGRVLDADTREPIEGAVVVASWLEEMATPTGPTQRLKEVKEVLTNNKGEWVMEGPRGSEGGAITALYSFFTGTYYTRPPTFIVFKPGYCSWPAGFGIEACKDRIKPEGSHKVAEGDTIELPKLTRREDRLKAQEIWPPLMRGDKESKRLIKQFIRLLNDERNDLGLSQDPMIKELGNEK